MVAWSLGIPPPPPGVCSQKNRAMRDNCSGNIGGPYWWGSQKKYIKADWSVVKPIGVKRWG